MMRFSKKIVFLALLVATVSLINVAYAGIADEAGGVISGFDKADGAGVLETPAGSVLGIINYIAIAVALGMIIVIGIKWMTAGAGGKATVKDTLLPYLIGAICVAAGTAIAKFAINLGQATQTSSDDNIVLCGCPTCDGIQRRSSGTSCGCSACQAGVCKCSSCK